MDVPRHNARGNYSFLPGGVPYSSGVVADEGFAVVHATLREPVPYRAGFDRIATHLAAAGRGRAALCAVELRIPAPFSFEGFGAFNAGYRGLIEDWDLLVEGENPVARTNVAPEWHPPAEPSLAAFSYTVPAGGGGRTFVVAGAGEMRGGSQPEVVRAGEWSPEAMAAKATHVMAVMDRRMQGLGVTWEQVTTTNLYTVRPMDAVLGPVLLDAMGAAARRGLHWYHARPPISDLEFEMDVRGALREEYLD